MITTTSKEFQRQFGRYQDEALKQPIAITKNGRERLVVMSAEEYHRLRKRARTVLKASEISQKDYDLLGSIEIPEGDEQWNHELEEGNYLK